jgi:D-alanine--poly(phosphoribitol) ligase subunit 1
MTAMKDSTLYGCVNLGQAFERVSNARATHTALSYADGTRISYAELNDRVERIAAALGHRGLKSREVVALFNHKSVDGIAAILACNKLGLLYANIDPASPPDRCVRILDRCMPSIILVDEPSVDAMRVISGPHADKLVTLKEVASADPTHRPISGTDITGSDGAYIMFTSGSTGFPKGAVITHQNLLNFIAWGRRNIGITEADTLTNVNPIYFDNSVCDLYVALYNGATLCPFTTDQVKDARALVKSVGSLNCTMWFSVPSMLVYLLTMRAIDSTSMPAMKRIMFGGEGFPKAKLKELHGLLGDRVKLINAYGPTECTCICSAYDISEKDFTEMDELAPLGHLAPDFYFHIDPLDASDPKLGELFLGGPNVGSGYYNDPDRTAKAFVQDPASPHYRKIMYRTGDLVQLGTDGLLRFKGRVDNQIKHMGYRIELEEVEAAFSALPAVHEVGVIYKTGVAGGPGSILAYVNANEGVTGEGLAKDITAALPTYMRPRLIFVQHTALPKNSNGKIDRQALKALAT